MSNLDCNTERGRQWIGRQREITDIAANYFGFYPTLTPDNEAGAIDVLFSDNGTLQVIAEVKARKMSLTQLRSFGSYLVTFEKLNKGRAIARALCVPFILVIGLIDDSVIFWQISDDKGNWNTEMEIRQTTTQATCNGGEVVRANAYLSLGFTIIQSPE